MHIVFFAYGDITAVNYFLHELRAQKFAWKFYKKEPYKKGEKEMFFPLATRVNVLPGGAIDIVIPKEHADKVLTYLKFNQDYYEIGYFKTALLRKIYRCKKAKFKQNNFNFYWVMDGVNIQPIGIREDGEQPEVGSEIEMKYGKGWFHEAM